MNTETTMITLKEFVANHKITMTSRSIARNPNTNNAEWKNAHHYEITLKINKLNAFVTYFSMGSAHTKAPTAQDVLNCLSSDSSSIDNSVNFEDWANELGYDPDSRKAEKTFNICVEQARELKQWLGVDTYNELLYSVEAL